MLDRELFRQRGDVIKQSLAARGENEKLVDEWIQADKVWREALAKAEAIKAKKNTLSRSKPTPAQLKTAQKLDKELTELNDGLAQAELGAREILMRIPNLVATDVPRGMEGEVIKKSGQPKIKSGKSHQELMTRLGWLDLKTAAEFSGSRFRYLIGQGAWLHHMIMNEAIRFAVKQGFEFVVPPVLTRAQTLEKAGFFPALKDDVFEIEKDQLYLVGTSEQTMLALAAGRTFKKSDLPKRFVGFSSCFRREVGSYGKDVEGMFRQHQFDKVEMVSVVAPEQSKDELQFLVEMEERFVRSLKIPYQLRLIGSEDLGATATKKIDVESWFPSQQRYRETHSASNCTDYQARRLNVKIQTDEKGTFAHTLNATLATERLLLAFVENNQRLDGTVALPWRYRV